MYYTENGDFMKSFSTYDGMAVQLLREQNIETVIITSENSNIVLQRAKKLNISNVTIGEKNKLERIKKICLEKEIDLSEVAYIGDDLNDVDVLKQVGFSALTQNSPIKEYIKVDYITKRNGGDGAFREFVDLILKNR
jgi:YrbI family 3-deoxy-D-manno-octulosonate 8-phosphate phosphatase